MTDSVMAEWPESIYDIPVWEDFPFALPDGMHARRCDVGWVLVLEKDGKILHVDARGEVAKDAAKLASDMLLRIFDPRKAEG